MEALLRTGDKYNGRQPSFNAKFQQRTRRTLRFKQIVVFAAPGVLIYRDAIHDSGKGPSWLKKPEFHFLIAMRNG
jgi:hypothetical protein